ncbi:VWA domain-containing protein [candidate division WOR-3 bacterium]|nr:VWA domain-containing protein [candidate division WOR-3 bacterium]
MGAEELRTPGPPVARRPLHFVWILDVSGSMRKQGKIGALNDAIRATIPAMRETAAAHADASIFVRAIRFSTEAEWHVAEPTPVERFEWDTDLVARGWTRTEKAIRLTAQALAVESMPARGLPPVLVLVSDGRPNDRALYSRAVDGFLAQPWPSKAVRLAVAVGRDAYLPSLERFIADPEIRPLLVRDAEQLVHALRWASTAVVGSICLPPSSTVSASSPGLIPAPPTFAPPASDGSVW